MGLLNVISVEEASHKLIEHLQTHQLVRTERVSLENAFLRILSQDIISPEALPNFNRSTVDGYAIKASESHGCSESLPSVFTEINSIEMGQNHHIHLESGQCVRIMTGGMLPIGADAVVMIEHTDVFSKHQVLVYKAISQNENVIWAAEEIQKQALVFNRYHQLSHVDIGLLAALGISHVEVFVMPKVAIISTGEEVFEVTDLITQAQVHDVNRSLIHSVLKHHHFMVTESLLIQDDEAFLEKTLLRLIPITDWILISGGSSQGDKDYTLRVIERIEHHEIFAHGLAFKPGKPTILARVASTLILGLPGQPVSAYSVLQHVLLSAFWVSLHQNLRVQNVQLKTNILGSPGRETMIFIDISQSHETLEAWPIYSKSGSISTLLNAKGYVIIPRNHEGYPAGALLEAHLL